MQNNSKVINSNQSSPHEDLDAVVIKHNSSAFLKPISAVNREAFEIIDLLYKKYQGHFILDSGCGVGESTYQIARNNPDKFVVGVDQSIHRLELNNNWTLPDNAFLIQANLIDFWRLAAEAQWQLYRHYLLYPNPWPKKKHLQRRWHGHPVFPTILELGGKLELRTNWKIYADEFKQAVSLLSIHPCQLETWLPEKSITPFERKYLGSNQPLYQLTVALS